MHFWMTAVGGVPTVHKHHVPYPCDVVCVHQGVHRHDAQALIQNDGWHTPNNPWNARNLEEIDQLCEQKMK